MTRRPEPPATAFQRLAVRLAEIAPGAPPIDLTVGGPRHPMPGFVVEALTAAADGFGHYPPIDGTPAFREAVHGWLDRRFDLGGFLRETGAVLPLNGSREGLFYAAIGARDFLAKPGRPTVLFANPFYATYAAAARTLGAEPMPIAVAAGAVMPDWSAIPADILDRAVGAYIASPSNPEGRVASRRDWSDALAAAKRHDFFLFADECYSEIYRERAGPPAGALEAARDIGSGGLDRLVVFNSLSKRSNLPGLRCGFLAGGSAFVTELTRLRNQAAPQVPTPVQAAAVAVLADEAHVAENRRLYDEKFAIAQALLGDLFGELTPPGGFFLWLDVGRWGDEVALVERLWRDTGVKTVPGSYLALTGPGGNNPGVGHIRLALVADPAVTVTALTRLRDCLVNTPEGEMRGGAHGGA